MTDPTGPEPAQEGVGAPQTAGVPAAPVPDSLDAVEAPQDGPDDDPGEWSDYDPNVAAAKARKEARSLRQRLRDTEAVRDELAEKIAAADTARQAAEDAADTARQRVTAAEQRRVEQIAETLGMVDGGDVWRGDRQLADFLDADGQLDPAKIAGTVRQVQQDAPHLVRATSSAHRQVNPDMSAAELIRHGVQPALDAPAEQWTAYRTARAKAARGGATPAGQAAPAGPTWGDLLRSAIPDTDNR